MQVRLIKSPYCTTVTFEKNKKLLTIDIWSNFNLSQEQVWLFILGLFDLPSYEVWQEYNPDLNPDRYNISSNFVRVIWDFFGADYLKEKMDELDW